MRFFLDSACPTEREPDWWCRIPIGDRCVPLCERKKKKWNRGRCCLGFLQASRRSTWPYREFKTHAMSPSATTPIKSFFFDPFFFGLPKKFYERLFLSLGKCLMTVAAAGMHINFTRILVKEKPEILNHKNLEMTSAAVGKNQILLEYHNAWSDKSVEWDSSPCRQFNWYIHSPFSLTSKKKKKSTALKV